jgi:type I restriction enzyme R subunit
MSVIYTDKSKELNFQNDIIKQMQANGWLLGKTENYDQKLALYSEDLVKFVKDTQPKEWEKYCKIYPDAADKKLLERVAQQLNKADPNAANKTMRTFGTLGVLRHQIKDRGVRFSLCQFRPEHGLNPDTIEKYEKNRLRVVPELVYSPYATQEHFDATGKAAKKWRIDLVLFVNGIPVATMELKSEFKQSVKNAKSQYMNTRPPVDPATKKAEPLLTFKRGALVHFAVSQYEVYMATRLAGNDTRFLPFNKGTGDGGAGNDTPANEDQYATDYLWNEVLLPDNLLKILAKYVHLEISEEEDWEGHKSKKENLIFPRYHQWDVVNRLINASVNEGPGHNYLIQHSAGSGKSNSIAWTAHQLSSLHRDNGDKVFNSVIIVTDRTVLDSQLQDTISQFEQTDGVVGRINREEGEGSKSEKLAQALTHSQPIIIVTIQTFPYVLKAIETDVKLQSRCYAIIADEAHSSQTGTTARKLKEVLMIDGSGSGEEMTTEEIIQTAVASRRKSQNLSYYAFTATPKTKTIELFGRLPNPDMPASKKNKPVPFHIYSMRQAIEEEFILDVLKNYTNYKVAYNLALAIKEADKEVESKRAKVRLNQWVKLHDYNISQKVHVIIEHFKTHVRGQLGGQAKAMVVTGSRKEAVRYKKRFDRYIQEKSLKSIHAMVAFSGKVEFDENDPDATSLKGRDLRTAFDSDDYNVMIVANKFQTGFDQPKLCAMYVDKKLGGVECVQTLSRLNRTYPGKDAGCIYVLDFFNEPEVILSAFQPYYQTAELTDVSDPNLVYDLSDKLRAADIFKSYEVEQFCEAFFQKSKSNAALANICKPAVDRWQGRYKSAFDAYIEARKILNEAKSTGNAVLIANSENSYKECKKEKDALEIFRKDLGTFVRFYEFMSQIVDYDDTDLEKLSLYARNLRPMLREITDEEDIDLSNVVLSHYRLSRIRQQAIKLKEDAADCGLSPSRELGTAKPKNPEEALLSQIIARLNEVFITDNLTDKDQINFFFALGDKVLENENVVKQTENNTPAQAMLGDFPAAFIDAVMSLGKAQKEMVIQILSNTKSQDKMSKMVFDYILMDKASRVKLRAQLRK